MSLQCEVHAFIIEYFFFLASCNELFSLQLLAVHKRIPWKHKEDSLAFPKQKKTNNISHQAGLGPRLFLLVWNYSQEASGRYCLGFV